MSHSFTNDRPIYISAYGDDRTGHRLWCTASWQPDAVGTGSLASQIGISPNTVQRDDCTRWSAVGCW